MYEIEYSDLATQVYWVLRELIITGELRPGQKLVQEELASRLGVSRTPLLSALSKLEQEKVVETLSRRGSFVKTYGPEDLLNLYDIRVQLEPLGARRAAEHVNASDTKTLIEVLARFERAVNADEPEGLRKSDFEFHMEIMKLSRNPFLYDMLDSFSVIIVANVQGLLKDPRRSLEEHLDLLRAIEEHRADDAHDVMRSHISSARVELLSQIRA